MLRLKPRPGYIHAPHPLDVCQIDHTPTDINFMEVVDMRVFSSAVRTRIESVCGRHVRAAGCRPVWGWDFDGNTLDRKGQRW
ncbi:hypothetical protein GGE07_005960 [Sinorhizobium terangae]|nr:hypothetical protein [Sinorhizobium terangae]